MPRIPESEINRIKTEVDLVALIQSKGIELKKHGGKDFAAKCPFHQDETASFIITPSKNLWHCMGCGKGGSVIDFVMTHEGISFRHAYEILADGKIQTVMKSGGGPLKRSTVPKLENPLGTAEDAALMEQVMNYYHQRLLATPSALDYLHQRGITEEALRAFKIGYGDRTLGLRLPEKNRKEGASIRSRLQRLGLYRESGHEHFNGCAVFPVRNDQGAITEMYGRKTVSSQSTGIYHLYLPGPHVGIFNREALLASREMILCESIIDALTFWCAGFQNVTTIYGTEGFTDELRQAFLEHKTQRVYLAYDRDTAGDRAAERDAEWFMGKGIECLRIKFPSGMDANEYARKVTPPGQSLKLLIQSAEWLGKGKGSALHPRKDALHPESVNVPAPSSSLKLAAKLAAESTVTAAPVPAMLSVEVALPLAKELGQLLKGVAHEVDEITGEQLPMVSSESLRTGSGWSPEPYWPAPYDEVIAQQTELRKIAVERGLLPVEPSFLAAETITEKPAANEKKVVETPELLPVERHGEDLTVTLGERQYRVRGLDKNNSFEVLKVNLRLMVSSLYYVNVIDIYHAKQRQQFIEEAAKETLLDPELIKRDLGKLLLRLEMLQEERINAVLAPAEQAVEMTDTERAEALALLRSTDLMERILEDFDSCGIVGEQTNKLTGYLAAISRKLDRPLAIIIQSTSAAGKSSLMEAVLSFMPAEEKIKYSAMTGQSLFYLGEKDLKHKILAIVEEEGAEKASYALKLLQSEGELTIASTSKDDQGRLKTEEYHVEGPVMIFLTTTAVDVDEELLNRCIVLTVDESREQTEAIHKLQREAETLEGLHRKIERDRILTLHQNAQRLLRPLHVVNPFAPRLTFLSDRTRTRRDHVKYLTFIRTIALLNQYQREVKTLPNGSQYIEVTQADIVAANDLAHEILGRSLDELPPQTRKLLGLLDVMANRVCEKKKIGRENFLFSRKEVRDLTGWGDTQLKIHLGRLADMEFLALHRHPRNPQGHVYELLYCGEGVDGKRFLPGLIDAGILGYPCEYDLNRSGQNGDRSGSGRPPVGGQSGPGREVENPSEPHEYRLGSRPRSFAQKNAQGPEKKQAAVVS